MDKFLHNFLRKNSCILAYIIFFYYFCAVICLNWGKWYKKGFKF